jgi:hypothetical protein
VSADGQKSEHCSVESEGSGGIIPSRGRVAACDCGGNPTTPLVAKAMTYFRIICEFQQSELIASAKTSGARGSAYKNRKGSINSSSISHNLSNMISFISRLFSKLLLFVLIWKIAFS